jgi:hypothetical protein
MKKLDNVLKEYVSRASDDTLKLLAGRLTQRLAGDLPDALNVLSETHEMDRLLCSAKTADDLYDIVDDIQEHVERELSRRYRDDNVRQETTVETDASGRPVVRKKRFTPT